MADGDQGRPPVVPFQLSPGRADQVVANADVPRKIDNLDAGMGFSRRLEQVNNGYAYTLPGYCRAPGVIFMPAGKVTEISMPAAPAGAFREVSTSELFDNKIFLVGSPAVNVLAADGLSATTETTFGPQFQGSGAAVFNNRLYVAGAAGGFSFRAAGGGWTNNAALQRHFLAVTSWRPLGIPTQVMLAITQDVANWGGLRWVPITADPMVDGNWGAAVAVGVNRQFVAGPIIAAPRHAYVTSPDGVYDLDELGTRSFNITPWMAEVTDASASQGGWGMHAGRGLYYAHAQGLAYVETASGETQYQPEWASPGFGLPWEGPIAGLPFAGTFANGWGMIGVYSPPIPQNLLPAGSSYASYVMAGRRDPGGPGGNMAYGQASHVWHGAEAVVPGRITHMKVHTLPSTGQPQLLICCAEGGTQGWHCYWQSLPKIASPLQELIFGGAFQPADLSTLFLSADPWDAPSAVKQLLQIDLIADRLQLGSDYLKVLASVDGAAFVDQGTAESDVYTSLAPSPVLEGRYLTTRIDNFGSAVLRSIELRAALGLQLREARTYRVILGWDNALKSARGRETADPDARMQDLQYLLGRVILLDDGTAGAPYRVRVLQIATGERRRLGGPERASANGTEGAWAVVVPVTVSFLDYAFRHDGPPTDRYDADRVWG